MTGFTVRIGAHRDLEELRQDLLEGGCYVSGDASEILSRIEINPEPSEVELAVVAVSELAPSEEVTRAEIYEAAQAHGYDLCPAEIGPELCLQYKDRLDEPQLFVGMEPVTVSESDVEVLSVGRYGPEVFLNVWNGAPDSVFYPDQRWLFVRKASA